VRHINNSTSSLDVRHINNSTSSLDVRHINNSTSSLDVRHINNSTSSLDVRHINNSTSSLDVRHINDDISSQQSPQISSLSFEMDIETELAAVIMDEVHYINDESRGHVWEQTILTLPPQIQMIMLSATLDGPEKFAEWIESTRPSASSSSIDRKQVYLAQTPTRIVPLSHYAYFPEPPIAITKKVKSMPFEHLVKQQSNTLIPLQTAYNVFQPQGYKNTAKLCDIWAENTHGPVSRKHVLNCVAKYMKGSDDMDIDDTMLPAIVFTFSRKQVEESAADITTNILAFDSKIPYTAAHECEQILRRLPNWREYIELPEYKSLVKLLEKGVGIHHSGMIPILREIVELRISEKKIFLLFATESFAIGLDCPIRTAIFTGLTKFDGSGDRFLYAHEYTQMAGRAGRRGIDTVGHVIHLPLLYKKGIPTETEYKTILSNKPQKLVSKFHIDYKMILSLLKKGIDRDFDQFVERSMSKTGILGELKELDHELEILTLNQAVLQNGMQHIRTPLDKCQEYDSLAIQLKTAVNKKRRDIERRLRTISDEHRYVLEDISLISRMRALERDIKRKESDIKETAQFLKTQTEHVCRILVDTGVLCIQEAEADQENSQTQTEDAERKYEFTTPLGIIAAQFAEVHPIPLAKLILSTDWFQGWSAKELVGLLSVFVDVRVPESSKEPECTNSRVKPAITELQSYYDNILDMEIEHRCYTGIEYGGALCFEMTDIMMEWCDREDAVDCKIWLQELVASGTVSAGDFAKACMKLSATAKELAAMCETLVSVVGVGSKALEFAHTLGQIDSLILKHIATTQSLYL
jgi:superfamily II RNA helicase